MTPLPTLYIRRRVGVSLAILVCFYHQVSSQSSISMKSAYDLIVVLQAFLFRRAGLVRYFYGFMRQLDYRLIRIGTAGIGDFDEQYNTWKVL